MPCPLLLRRACRIRSSRSCPLFGRAGGELELRRNIGKSAELYCYSAVICKRQRGGIAYIRAGYLALERGLFRLGQKILYVSSGDSSPSLTSNAITLPGSKVLAFGSFIFCDTFSGSESSSSITLYFVSVSAHVPSTQTP